MFPLNSFNVADIDTLYRLQKLNIPGSIHNNSVNVEYNGTLYIKAYGPKIHKTYSISNINRIYTMPGKKFYNGEIGPNLPCEKTVFAITLPM